MIDDLIRVRRSDEKFCQATTSTLFIFGNPVMRRTYAVTGDGLLDAWKPDALPED